MFNSVIKIFFKWCNVIHCMFIGSVFTIIVSMYRGDTCLLACCDNSIPPFGASPMRPLKGNNRNQQGTKEESLDVGISWSWREPVGFPHWSSIIVTSSSDTRSNLDKAREGTRDVLLRWQDEDETSRWAANGRTRGMSILKLIYMLGGQ